MDELRTYTCPICQGTAYDAPERTLECVVCRVRMVDLEAEREREYRRQKKQLKRIQRAPVVRTQGPMLNRKERRKRAAQARRKTK